MRASTLRSLPGHDHDRGAVSLTGELRSVLAGPAYARGEPLAVVPEPARHGDIELTSTDDAEQQAGPSQSGAAPERGRTAAPRLRARG